VTAESERWNVPVTQKALPRWTAIIIIIIIIIIFIIIIIIVN